MPSENSRKLAKEWFKKAQDDYKSARVVLREGGYYGTTCFLAQQIAEKYFKGFLIFYGEKVKKIHDLIKLLNECKKIDGGFSVLEEECILLNDYYIETRYPHYAPIDYSRHEAKLSMDAVDRISEFILTKVG
ncbi:MAG: HEPN domain-containing protein [Patescibacteria group bacterium]